MVTIDLSASAPLCQSPVVRFSFITRPDSKESDNVYKRLTSKYPGIDLHDSLLEESLWEKMFSKGLIDTVGIEESLRKSQYFRSENTPDWVRLWHAIDLEDDEFDRVFRRVSKKFEEMLYDKVGIVKHVIGLFLWLSEIGLYLKSKEQIRDFAKSYIDRLKDIGALEQDENDSHRVSEHEGWGGLGFHAKDTPEFQDITAYIKEKSRQALVESYPKSGKGLLEVMRAETDRFYRMIVLSNHHENRYYEVPILKYIEPLEFVSSFMALNPEQRRIVCYAFAERYKFEQFNEKLVDEAGWLENVIDLLTKEKESRQGKISGHTIGRVIEECLKESLGKLRRSQV